LGIQILNLENIWIRITLILDPKITKGITVRMAPKYNYSLALGYCSLGSIPLKLFGKVNDLSFYARAE
jgi:hypothetical protein